MQPEETVDLSDDLRVFLDGCAAGAAVVDRQLRLVYANEIYQRLCREGAEPSLFTNHDVGLRALEVGRPLRILEQDIKIADAERVFNVVAVPLPHGCVAEVFHEGTDERAMQQSLKVLLREERRRKRDLESLVAARTKELRQANENLKQTQAQLVQSEKMSSMGFLVAGIAHELNNPINYIAGNADYLEEHTEVLLNLVSRLQQKVSAPERRALEQEFPPDEVSFLKEDLAAVIKAIKAGAERAAAIISDLKAFSRMSRGSKKSADLSEGIRTSLVLLGEKARDMTINLDLDPTPVYCEQSSINQVFMNILTNAAQAAGPKGMLWISSFRVDDEMVYEFADSGPGIPEEIRSKVFDPFFTTKSVGEGTGLGLSISFSIVQAHGGRIEVDRRDGAGALIRVSLPIHERKAETAAPKQQ